MQLYAILCNRLHVITYDILYMIWGWVKTLHPCSWTTAYRRPWVLGGVDNVLGCPPYKIFSWTCCYAIHSSLAPYPGTRYQLLLVTCKTLLIFALLFLGGVWGGLITFLAARLTSFNDPAMDVASNNFAVFSQRIDVMPCRSAEEISWLSMTASSTETNSLTALQND